LGKKVNANFPLNAWQELPVAVSLGLSKCTAIKTSQKHCQNTVTSRIFSDGLQI